ncbi:MAG: multifunctional nuclease/2,3-cyclic-nucleotide, partial [Candidatus Saccharibacteria bacterium]|nr:multifunctional nuclease/2,3-cyclic-nucleotide [Candidatus Saccharibacteria bacterium]
MPGMSRVAQHLRVGIALLSVLLLICLPLQATAASPSFLSSSIPKVIITELQTAGDTSSQEFIEIYNLTDVDIDFADTVHGGKELWKLQFFSAANTSTGAPDWSKPSATISLQGTIPAGGYYLLASTGYLPGGIDADQEYNPRLSDTGGGLQIVTTTTTTTTAYDHLMWKQSSADKPLVRGQWPTPAAKASLQRLPNDEDLYQNTDNSLTDFVAAAEISPKDMWRPVVVEEIVPIEPTTPPIDEEEPIGLEEPSIPEIVGNPAELMSPYLTELLPNPAAPLKDETDEFIELYNPNEAAFNLKGYTLEVGTTTLHDFTFTEDFIVPGRTYTAFYSKDTRLSLTNTGGQARLLGLEGNVLSESQPYTSADDGMAWVFADGIWQWSANATPGLINSVT